MHFCLTWRLIPCVTNMYSSPLSHVALQVEEGCGLATAEDIAATMLWVATLPPHLNINRLELMPVSQSFAGFQVARKD